VGYGGVYLDQMGLQKAAALLSITPYELTSLYLEPIGNRWSVKTGRDGRCLFYHEGCLIHRAKPLMCRAWPFFKRPLSSQEGFLEASEHCAALKNLDYESFLAAYEAIGRPLPPA
jgi:Fe-S-cluster containining protein